MASKKSRAAAPAHTTSVNTLSPGTPVVPLTSARPRSSVSGVTTTQHRGPATRSRPSPSVVNVTSQRPLQRSSTGAWAAARSAPCPPSAAAIATAARRHRSHATTLMRRHLDRDGIR